MYKYNCLHGRRGLTSRAGTSAAALGPAGEAMAGAGPGAGEASGGASGGGAGASAGSGSSEVGDRLPSRVLELVFSYLELSELRSCALVCKHWYRCLHDDESREVWRSLCSRSLAEEALRADILCNLPSYKAKVRAFQHAFNTNDCSRNVYIKKNGFTLYRNPIDQSTDGARTKISFSEGRYAWEVWWEGPLDTVAVIGIATKRPPCSAKVMWHCWGVMTRAGAGIWWTIIYYIMGKSMTAFHSATMHQNIR